MTTPTLHAPKLNYFKHHYVVWVVIIACSAVFLMMEFSVNSVVANPNFWQLPGTIEVLYQEHSYWKLITPCLLHFSAIHILVNLYTWWLFASKIEEVSRKALCVVGLVSAIFSNGAEWFVSGENFGGLSGVVYALVGYCGVLYYIGKLPAFRTSTELNVILIALIPLSATGFFGSFANTAHNAGLICGLCFGFYQLNRSRTMSILSE